MVCRELQMTLPRVVLITPDLIRLLAVLGDDRLELSNQIAMFVGNIVFFTDILREIVKLNRLLITDSYRFPFAFSNRKFFPGAPKQIVMFGLGLSQ